MNQHKSDHKAQVSTDQNTSNSQAIVIRVKIIILCDQFENNSNGTMKSIWKSDLKMTRDLEEKKKQQKNNTKHTAQHR